MFEIRRTDLYQGASDNTVTANNILSELEKNQPQATSMYAFERFDEDGSGILDLPDGRTLIEVGEHTVGFKSMERKEQRYDLSFALRFVRQEPDIARWYGYESIIPDAGALARVVIPSPEQFNERKNALPPDIGVNRASFESVQGAHFGAVEYLGYLANRKIPIATEANEKAHDMCAHMGGFAIMASDVFEFLSMSASESLDRDDYYRHEHQGAVAGMIDGVSGMLTGRTTTIVGSYLSVVHSLPIPKSEMIGLVSRLEASQAETTKSLRAFVRSQL